MSALCKSCGHDEGCAHEVTTHELKVWPAYYEAIERGEKRFEARKDDRGFQVGDVLFLREWDPDRNDGTRYGVFTGRGLRRTVTYILRGPGFGVEAGFVVMSIESEGDAALRERAEKAEATVEVARSSLRYFAEHLSEHVYQELESSLNGPNREQEDALARLARYEAPGPALLTAEHGDYCYSVVAPGDDNCSCTKAIIDAAYREQHARCMAVVERLMREIDEDPRASHLGLYAGGVRMALAALTGEAEK